MGEGGLLRHTVDERRRHLRVLDSCLERLEDLNEHGTSTVTADVARLLSPHVPGVWNGMRVGDALNMVLNEQRQYLDQGARRMDGSMLEQATFRPPLDEASARNLTERIRAATRQVCLLLMEAHEGRAWSALGYPSWEAYVRDEFGFSRSRSYELVDQGRVLTALAEAAGVSGIPDISAYAAQQVKPYLPELISEVKACAAGLSESEAHQLLQTVISRARSRSARSTPMTHGRPTVEGSQMSVIAGEISSIDLSRLSEAINFLARLPPASQVVTAIPYEFTDEISRISEAVSWLSAFEAEWRHRPQLVS